jgi:hypothetical protein
MALSAFEEDKRVSRDYANPAVWFSCNEYQLAPTRVHFAASWAVDDPVLTYVRGLARPA